MAQLSLQKVNKIYDNGFHAVYNFDLEVATGEFIVFVGPSGCGKSTMLRMIAGLEEITDGQFYIDGRLCNQLGPKARGIAMIFQSYALYPHLTVYGNIAFGLELEGFDEDYIQKRVKDMANILGLTQYLDRLPRQLSGGQCQRVAVGRALIRNPKVFLMDEPLSNLDAKQRVSMRAEIIEIHRAAKATTIYVTHDQVEAMTMADRIVVMRDGYIQQVGSPKQLYFRPQNKFVAGFIGDPPMNFFSGIINSGSVELLDGGGSLNIAKVFPHRAKEYEGRKVILGIRPEAIRVLKKQPPESEIFLKVETEMSEVLGDNANIYMKCGENKLVAQVLSEELSEAEKGGYALVDKKDIYLFDAVSEKAIYEDEA